MHAPSPVASVPAAPIRILLLTGDGPYYPLLERALEVLGGEGFGRRISRSEALEQANGGTLLLLGGARSDLDPGAAVEGGLSGDFQLALADLGIEPEENGGFSEADLQLAVDGIRAVCTVTGGPTPGHHCPCR